MDEATWLSSDQFGQLYDYLKDRRRAASALWGKRKLRLLACAVCRSMLWHLSERDTGCEAVRVAEAFADGLIDQDALDGARTACCNARSFARNESSAQAFAWEAMWSTGETKAAAGAAAAAANALNALGPHGKAENRRRLCALVRDVFGNPFCPLPSRAFPGHVVGLARECYEAFPEVSDRFLILADALADLSEDGAAEHCRQGGHVKGCHVVDWVLGRK